MTIRLMRLIGNTEAIPVTLGPSIELIVTTTETNAATARARTGRSYHRRGAGAAGLMPARSFVSSSMKPAP